MIGPGTITNGADALSDTIGGMFDIPENQFVEQIEDTFTIGSGSESGQTNSQPEEPWDPFAGW